MNDRQGGWQQWLVWWLLYVASWVGSSALTLWLTLQLRINLIDLNNFFGWGAWILIGVDKFGILLLGLAWLISVFVIEMHLRGSRTIAQLWQRSWHLFCYMGGGLLLSFLLQWLLV